MSENKLIKISFSIIIFVIFIFGLSCHVFSDSLNELKDEQAEIETQEKAAKSELKTIKKDLTDLQIEIAELNDNIINLEYEINSLNAKTISLSTSIQSNKESIEKLSKEYAEKKELLEKRLVETYKEGDTRYLDVLLSSKSITDFISSYYLINEVIESDNSLMDLVYSQKKDLEAKQIKLENERKELTDSKEKADKKQVSLENMKVVKKSYVSQLSNSEKTTQDKITEYQKKLKEIENEIAILAENSIGGDYNGGTMRWPVPGYSKITSPFGMRVHPITKIYKLHTGTDIGAPTGANFIAAADGKVIKSCYNTAYGNMVMIDHGGGVVTLYAHGSKRMVSEGDYVRQGETVLKVGSTGYATGPHAHFEVRINGAYKNPLNYVSP